MTQLRCVSVADKRVSQVGALPVAFKVIWSKNMSTCQVSGGKIVCVCVCVCVYVCVCHVCLQSGEQHLKWPIVIKML